MRKVLCSDYPHIELFADSGVVILLSNLLMSTNEDIRIEAAWCLTNIATGDHYATGWIKLLLYPCKTSFVLSYRIPSVYNHIILHLYHHMSYNLNMLHIKCLIYHATRKHDYVIQV